MSPPQQWYENGQYHGTYQDWHENGQLQEQCEFINGKRHGICQQWYPSGGQLCAQSEWKNGKRHGIQYFWASSGALLYIQQYWDDELLVIVEFLVKKPTISIDPDHPNVGVGLIDVIKVLQERGIKYKFAKIGE